MSGLTTETPHQRSNRIATAVEAACQAKCQASQQPQGEQKTPPAALPKFPNLGVCFEVIHELMGHDSVGGLTQTHLVHKIHFGNSKHAFEPLVPRLRTNVEDYTSDAFPTPNRQEQQVHMSRVTAGTPWAPEDPAVGVRVQVKSINDPSGRPLMYPAKILAMHYKDKDKQVDPPLSCDVEYVQLTTDEFKRGIIVPLTKNAGCCFAELLQERVRQIEHLSPSTPIPEKQNIPGKKLVAPATHFISHAWKYKFADVVSALTSYHIGLSRSEQKKAYYWLDVLTVDQNMKVNPPTEWWSSVFRDAIAKFGHVLLVLSPAKNPIPFTRSWCLWELWSTIEQNVNLQMLLTGDARREMMALCDDDGNESTSEYFQAFVDAYCAIDIEHAEAFNKEDQKSILQAVNDSIGVQQLNTVTRAQCLGQLLPYVAAGGNMKRVKILLSKGCELNVIKYIPPEYTMTAVGFALASGHFEVAMLLLEAGADPTMKDQYGNTLLHFAASHEQVTLCRDLILKYGLDPNPLPTTNMKRSPLCEAVCKKNYTVVSLLLGLGAHTDFLNPTDMPKQRRIRGTMPLHRACRNDDPGMVDLLLKAGANVNAAWMSAYKIGGPGHTTALMMAAKQGDEALVSTLLSGGADVTIENEAGETAYDMAVAQQGSGNNPCMVAVVALLSTAAKGKKGSGKHRGEYLEGLVEKREERSQRGRHKKRCGMSGLIGTLCVVVLLLVGVVVGGNIDGKHTLFAGDHFADRAVLGNYWGTNGDTLWYSRVTFSRAAAEYSGGSCFASTSEYMDWNKLWGKGRCGYTHSHHQDSDRFVWRRLQSEHNPNNCAGQTTCYGIQIASYSYDAGTKPYGQSDWRLLQEFTTILKPDVEYALGMESFGNGSVAFMLLDGQGQFLEQVVNDHEHRCSNFEQGMVLGLYFGGTCTAPLDITVTYAQGLGATAGSTGSTGSTEGRVNASGVPSVASVSAGTSNNMVRSMVVGLAVLGASMNNLWYM